METIECRVALERLSTYLTNPKRARSDVDAALSHLRDCSDCRHRIGYLVRALKTDAIDQLDCRRCQERLPEYVTALEEGFHGGARWRNVALHLVLCPHCVA